LLGLEVAAVEEMEWTASTRLRRLRMDQRMLQRRGMMMMVMRGWMSKSGVGYVESLARVLAWWATAAMKRRVESVDVRKVRE
jgi:hypothetical protein